jgi:hypothetical protein
MVEKIHQRACGVKFGPFCATANEIHGSSLEFRITRGKATRIRRTYKLFLFCDK